MGQFNATILTEKGLSLQMKAQMGIARLQFTRIGIGDGYASVPLETLDELVNELMSLPILEIKLTGEGQSQVKAAFSNTGLASGIYVREIGLFANDPDVGEILYSVANAGSFADYLPAENGTEVIEEVINFITVIGSASDVTAIIEQKALVTVDTFEAHVNDPSIHITRAEFDSQIASLRNEVQLIKSTFPDSFTRNLFTEDLSTINDIDLSRGYYNEAQTRLEV
ncbi:phage tail protein [Brevibacillus nitrificans]|uniref:phage tail-collar fiber domain-containing protein n=1 Tax=Brevibacillus nitrificans TaxID=651560 RepID=UPI0028608B89|nr:phage tail protein [Brevibacillus nitrificans]MDR7318926.1 hypothetical protein [Brevibacillus nitrificans]